MVQTDGGLKMRSRAPKSKDGGGGRGAAQRVNRVLDSKRLNERNGAGPGTVEKRGGFAASGEERHWRVNPVGRKPGERVIGKKGRMATRVRRVRKAQRRSGIGLS